MNGEYKERFQQLVSHYNHDRGTDLPDVPDERRYPHRAICANVAWCMLDKDRFWEYYNKSDYWKVALKTSARQFGVKNYEFHSICNKEMTKNLIDKLYGYISNNIGKKVYLTPGDLSDSLCINTVFTILYDVEGDFYEQN